MDQCAAAVPNALMKHLGCYPLTNHDGDHREQHGNHDNDKKCSLGLVPCITEPSHLIDQRFRTRDWVITRLTNEHSPDRVSALPDTAWELVRRVVFFYDNLGVFVAYKVIGQDLPSDFMASG